MASSQTPTAAGNTNRLGAEKSPYLLQHASNPVHWYPWGEEAFSIARRENKLIFLSVGYSTCHWCHVMERESFENPDIAKIMNANFVNVKVDREERPDVDKVYMSFVTASSGRGGWPMSVFLTPDLIPVAGGTYFPPVDRFGRIGFPTLLTTLAGKWRENESKFRESGSKIMEVLNRNARLSPPTGDPDMPGEEAFARCFSQFSQMYEPEYGGFSDSPKFPQPSNFNYLFTYHALFPELDDAKKGLSMALHTLDQMDRGGIHDHVAQGFARYSTDKRWHVPHFEKMLYDQAQLVVSYLDAFVATGRGRYADVVRDILTYVTRDLSHPSGGFYSAEDADSLPTFDSDAKREGAFCVWTHQEVKKLLGGQPISPGHEVTLAQLFSHHYSVVEGGNVDPYQDPHDELKEQNVLIEHGSLEETGREFDLSVEQCEEGLAKARDILFQARKLRPRPHLDNKMLTAWNGMMLGSMARAGAVLGEPEYVKRAVQAGEFIRDHMMTEGALLRAAYVGDNNKVSLGSSIVGFVDDYAWTVRGFMNLYEATLDSDWLSLAEKLQDKQNQLFWDDDGGGGYFMTQPGDDSILLRIKEDQDGAEPSANSVSAGNLVRLSPLLNRADLTQKAEGIFRLFSERLKKVPVALPEMTTALLLYHKPPTQIILAGEEESESLSNMLRVIHRESIPCRVLLVSGDSHTATFLNARHPSLTNYKPKSEGGDTLAYVCHDFRCLMPVDKPDLLKETLKRPAVASQ